MSVFVLVAIGSAMIGYETLQNEKRARQISARDAGRFYATWINATHLYSQENQSILSSVVETNGGQIVTPSTLASAGLVSSGLATKTSLGQDIVLGIIGDDDGVPMAFAVLRETETVSGEMFASFLRGAGEFGASNVSISGYGDLGASVNEAKIEAILGGAIQKGDIIATADTAIELDENVLYRRKQPGRARLNAMRTALDLGSSDAKNIGKIQAESGQIKETLQVTGDAAFGGNVNTAGLTSGPVTAQRVVVPVMTAVSGVTVNDLLVGTLSTDSLSATRLDSTTADASGAATSSFVSVADQITASGTATLKGLSTKTMAVADEASSKKLQGNTAYAPSGTVTNGLTTTTCFGCPE